MPFHKLSQWLTYSLLEPFGWAGVQVEGVDALTGLPEYRNGGLLLDTGVLRLRDPAWTERTWTVGDELVVEWRALTVALLDELAPLVRSAPRRGRRTDAAGVRARGRHLGGGPRAGPAPAWRAAAAVDRQRRHGLLDDCMGTVHLIDHPLVQHKLTLMRRKDASTNSFRQLLHEVSALMAYEVLRDMPMHEIEIETPLESTTGKVIDGKKLVFVSILRAGTGILDGMLTVVPGARVGHIGLYRDPKTLVAVEYYFKMPGDLHERDVVVVDPMLATGNSAVAAVERLKECRPKSIKFVCLLTCPEGIAAMDRRPSRRADLHRRRRPPTRRARLHPARPRRRRRPHLRHEIAPVHWIVDGMNVIGSRPDGWWRDRGLAMATLVEQLERWATTEGDDVTVVFERPPSPPIESSIVAIAHAPKAAPNSADDEIVRLVRADANPAEIRVATSDRTLSERVTAAGASVFPAERLRNLIDPR